MFTRKEKISNAVLHKNVEEIWGVKEENYIVPLEKALELFSPDSVKQEMDRNLE